MRHSFFMSFGMIIPLSFQAFQPFLHFGALGADFVGKAATEDGELLGGNRFEIENLRRALRFAVPSVE